jgi:membrane dipeptidase
VKPRALPLLTLSACLALALAAAKAPPPPAPPEDAALRHARALLSESILIDGHNDLPWAIRTSKTAARDVVAYDLRRRTTGQTDLPRLREGGVGGQFWSVYVPGEEQPSEYARVQLEQIDIARRTIARYPDALGLALTADDVEREFRRGRIASLLGMEGGHTLHNSLGALRSYYDLGVRYLTLTHNVTLDWADSAAEPPRHGGLTRFGEEVVREMNRLGMLVDLSHTSEETMADALRVSEAPVIFSHSSARAVCDVPRNVPDAILVQMPRNGGVVMVTFVAGFISQDFATEFAPLWDEYKRRTRAIADAAERDRIFDDLTSRFHPPTVTIAQVADHFDHIRKIAGVDHIGIGGDYDGNTQWPAGLEDVSRYPYLFAELLRRGWTDDDLRKVAGRNVLRVLRQAEATGRRLQADRPASIATIEELDTPKGR